MSNIGKIIVVFGLAIVAIGVAVATMRSPSFSIDHQHQAAADKTGDMLVQLHGVNFNNDRKDTFAGGGETPMTMEQMVNQMMADAKECKFLEQKGSAWDKPIRRVKIEVWTE